MSLKFTKYFFFSLQLLNQTKKKENVFRMRWWIEFKELLKGVGVYVGVDGGVDIEVYVEVDIGVDLGVNVGVDIGVKHFRLILQLRESCRIITL